MTEDILYENSADTQYPPHAAQVVTSLDKDLEAALAKFTKTSSCPAYLKTAYQKAKAQ